MRFVFFFVSMLAVLTYASLGALARDRPATPIELAVKDCGIVDGHPSICGTYFTDNHGSGFSDEEVIVESILTENGHAISSDVTLGCQRSPDPQVPSTCIGGPQSMATVAGSTGSFQIFGAHFGSAYCIKLRERRISDQVVSGKYTNFACQGTMAAPASPTAPNIQTRYTGSQMVMVAGKRQDFPSQMEINTPTFPLTTTTVSIKNGAFLTTAMPYVYQIYPSDDLVRIEVCYTNVSGKNCASKVVSIVRQIDVEINGKRTMQAGLSASAAPMRFPGLIKPSPAPVR